MRETDLYPPVKALLEGQGYTVKAEVKDCDVVAVRGDEAPVIVELKLNLSLALMLQGIDRQSITDAVYLAVPRGKGKRFLNQMNDAQRLCKRLGLGIMAVNVATGLVKVYCDPAPYQPRKVKKRFEALLKEFDARVGDPNKGGQVGAKIITAYRQDVLRMIDLLDKGGQMRPKDFVAQGIEKAPSILSKDHYGWFYRVERGVYALSDLGVQAVVEYKEQIQLL